MVVDLCKVVACHDHFSKTSDMKFGIQKPYLQCKNMWGALQLFAENSQQSGCYTEHPKGAGNLHPRTAHTYAHTVFVPILDSRTQEQFVVVSS